jgi:hypothetical protein
MAWKAIGAKSVVQANTIRITVAGNTRFHKKSPNPVKDQGFQRYDDNYVTV